MHLPARPLPALLLLAACAACAGDEEPASPPEAPRPDGHARMIAALAEAVRTTEEAPLYGSAGIAAMREKVDAWPADEDESLRITHLVALGQAELQLGNIEAGLERLTEAFEAIPADSDRRLARTALKVGVGYMRLGETENCCLRNSPESCIVPIRGGGVHTATRGSREAIGWFEVALAHAEPGSEVAREARWLLNLAYMTLGEFPDGVPADLRLAPGALESEIEFPRFPNVAGAIGLDSFNLSGGAAIDDFDGDGYLDLFTSTWDLSGPCRLFVNGRDGTFEERIEEAGLAGITGGLNLMQADYDNDGDVDVLVLRGAWLAQWGQVPNSLLRNDGTGRFTDVTFEAGLGEVHRPTQVAGWADYDNDGWLDLFVGNETTPSFEAPCQLFHNEGDGTFTDVAEAAGLAHRGYPKGVAWGDFDDDGDPDLYLSDYAGPNSLYENRGDGTFTDVAWQLGVAEPVSSFPTWFWDFDNDGHLDLFASSYAGRVDVVGAHYAGLAPEHERARLYRNDGAGGFVDVAEEYGLTAPMLPMGANFGDLDGDGWLDFYLGTGDPDYKSLMPNLMFVQRDGRFVDVTMAGGFGHVQKGHSISFADLDNDGDQDVFAQMGGAFRGDAFNDALFENPGFGNHFLALDLVGVRSNRSAVGARITASFTDGGRARTVHRRVGTGGSFGANPLRQTLGLGGARRVERLEVHWPTSGTLQVFEDLGADQWLRIVEGADEPERLDLRPTPLRPHGPGD